MTLLTCFDDVSPMPRNQQLLLGALLAEPPRDQASLEGWIEEIDFDRLDYASLRLVPALFKRFSGNPACEPYRARMKGIYRYFHYRTNLLAADARKTMQALTAAGVEWVVFKGLAIALRYHRDIAIRPMGDVDILIRREDLGKAEGILQALGWKYRYAQAKKPHDLHSHDYINGNKSGLDLHWHSLHESPVAGIDDVLWQRTETLMWQGLSMRIMGREDLVLTAMINGMREPESMYCGWIFDVAAIVRERPGFDWDLVWNEAGRRGLRKMAFDAMSQLHQQLPDLLTAARLHGLLESDPELMLHTLHRLVVENRTASLDAARRHDVNALFDPRPVNRLLHSILPGRSAYGRLARDPSTPKYIRYTMTATAEGWIDSLYLHSHALAWLPQLFRFADSRARKALATRRFQGGEGWLAIEPGVLALPERDTLPTYGARIELCADSAGSLRLRAGAAGEVMLRVWNDSPCCWFVRESSTALYGVSYHLLSEDGTMLAWDQPRTYFMTALDRHIAFVAPGQWLNCRMRVHAPPAPGRYRLQLDVVQEHVLWFSGQGIHFPVVELHVDE